jgi:hypothetical protein
MSETALRTALPLRIGDPRDWDPRPAGSLPSAAVEFVEEGWFRQVRFVTFRLYPLRPGPSGAVLAERFTLRVEHAGSAGETVADHPAFDSAYQRLFVNEWKDKGGGNSRAAGQRDGGTAWEEPGVSSSILPSPPSALDPSAFSLQPSALTTYRPSLAPGSSAYKIKVRTAGIYKLDYNFFLARNIPVNDIAKLHVQNLGADVAIRVEENAPANNTLEPGEAVYFYGRPYTGEEGDWNQPSDLWQHGDFTDENVYWVFCGTVAGARMAVRSVTPRYATDATQFAAALTFEQDALYRPFVPVRNDDLWLWKDAYWYKGSPDDIVVADHLVTIPSVDGTIGTATLALTVRGRTSDAASPDHSVQVSVNGTSVGSFTFDGNAAHTASFSFPQSRLLTGTQVNTVRVQVADPVLLGLYRDAIQTNRFTLTYRRKLEAHQNQLAFPVGADVVDYPVRAFTSNDIKGVDATNPAAPVWLSGIGVSADGSNYKATLSRGTASGTPTYFLAVPVAPASADVTVDAPSDLLASAAGKNWILVAPSVWTGHSLVAALAAQRAGQGYTPLIADITDIFDEFSHGLMSPLALRAFFDAAYHLSSPSALVGAVLLGDGTLDYKNNAGFGFQNIIPTLMIHDETGGTSMVPIAQYAWDNYYACVAGSDLIPDFYLGRVPAQTTDDVANALAKIINFSAPADPSYQNGNVFVAGCRDGDQWDAYQDANAALVTPAPPHTVSKMYYRGAPWNCVQKDTDGDGVNDFNEDLTAAFNAGRGTVSYIGHGSFQFWDDHSILQLSDLAAMTNAAQPAVVLNADCYTSAFFFSFSNPSILEAMLTASGGSAASGGPGGFMYNFQSGYMTALFYEGFYGLEEERRLGPLFHAVIAGVEATGDQRATKGYVELGDPLAEFALPTPGPPLNLHASVDCREVTLTWNPPSSGGPFSYRVYRAPAASGPWALLEDKVLGLAYTDATGAYGQTYHYRVTARDEAGYEGKGSAAVSVTLDPCAPNPPQNLVCHDPALGGRLDIVWDPVNDPEVVGYTVSWGTVSGTYLWSMDIPDRSTASARLGGLATGQAVHIAIRSRTAQGALSAFSVEAVCTPTAAGGWAPPEMVFPVRLAKDGAGLRLTWTLPTRSIWGTPAAVERCSVYRSTHKEFAPDRSDTSPDRAAWVQAADCPGGACGWTDPAPPEGAFYYVTCETAAGEESPISLACPSYPAYSLYYEETPGNYVVEWSAVGTRMDGSALAPPVYEVYRGQVQDFQPDAKNRSNRVGVTTDTVFSDAAPPGTPYCYKVMAMDALGNAGPH